MKTTNWRSRRHWEWAETWASLFYGMLPKHVCNAAMATCRITLQGPQSVGQQAKNWGRWIRMRMQTFGHIPDGLRTAAQRQHHWIATDSHTAAEQILACFGLSLDDVFAHYGKPAEGEKMTIDLIDLVTSLAPDFELPTSTVAVA